MEKTHWKKLDNPDYLGAYAFQPGEEKTLQIASVGKEMVYNPTGNKKEECTVIKFSTPNVKPMILNTTNAKTITKIYKTPYIEEWTGKLITTYVAQVKAFGEVVDAVRIRGKIPSLEKITCVDCGADVLGAGGKTAKEMADMGKANCGRILCLKCMKEEKKKMESREE